MEGSDVALCEHSSHRTLSIEQAPRIHRQLGMELMSISPICLRSGASPLGLWRAQTNSHLPALHHGLPPHTSTHVHSASLVWSVTLRIPYFQNSPSLRLPPSLSFFLSLSHTHTLNFSGEHSHSLARDLSLFSVKSLRSLTSSCICPVISSCQQRSRKFYLLMML